MSSNALAAAQGVLRRVAAAASEAWRHDRVFRWASIGAGVTLVLLALRLADSPRQRLSPGESRSVTLPPAAATSTPGSSLSAPAAVVPAAIPEVPRIAPSQSLNGVVVAPASSGDRFGTVTPASHP